MSEQQYNELKLEKPSFKSLKEQAKICLKNRKQDMQIKISDEDIQLINDLQMDIPKRTILGCAGLYCVFALKNHFKIQSFVALRNPLIPQETVVYKGKLNRLFMQNHIIALTTAGICIMHIVKFEIAKYYMFLKYENLVHSYLDCCDRRYIQNLEQTQKQQNLLELEKIKVQRSVEKLEQKYLAK